VADRQLKVAAGRASVATWRRDEAGSVKSIVFSVWVCLRIAPPRVGQCCWGRCRMLLPVFASCSRKKLAPLLRAFTQRLPLAGANQTGLLHRSLHHAAARRAGGSRRAPSRRHCIYRIAHKHMLPLHAAAAPGISAHSATATGVSWRAAWQDEGVSLKAENERKWG